METLARSPVISCSTSLNYSGALVLEVPMIGIEVKRVTKETNVSVKSNLDGTGVSNSNIDVSFLDHTLDNGALSPISPRLQLQYSIPAAQQSKAVVRVAPANHSGSASRICLSSSTGSKSRGFMGDSPTRSPIVSCSASLQKSKAFAPAAPTISASGRIGEVKKVTKEMNVSTKINLVLTGVAISSTGIPGLDHMLDVSSICGRL